MCIRDSNTVMENKPIMLAQANALTQARYDFKPIEKRCLYQIIREVRRLFIDSNTGQRDLFNNMRVKLTPDPVSYTHLDVYKRQLRICSQNVATKAT